MINQNNGAAISDADLDRVAGGFFAAFFENVRGRAIQDQGTTGGSGGGCRNDPCAQFQAIMDQLVPK